MRTRIVIVAATVLLLEGWMLRRHQARMRTELAPATVVADVPEMPATHVATTTAATPVTQVERQPTTNLIACLLKGDLPTLLLDELKTFLEANHRDAESLLGAYQLTHERALLDEAIAKFRNDPRVAYTAWFRSQPNTDDPDALQAHRQALNLLKQAAPDNALANYLSAANYFKSGQPQLALMELQAGAAKPVFNDYTQDAIQSMEEAYRAAGYSDVESKAAATTGVLLPHLAEMKQAGLSLVALANSYQQAGDPASAQAALQMCLDLGQRLDDPNSLTLIQPLVGIAAQDSPFPKWSNFRCEFSSCPLRANCQFNLEHRCSSNCFSQPRISAACEWNNSLVTFRPTRSQCLRRMGRSLRARSLSVQLPKRISRPRERP